jgi:hypothetical protein
MIIGASADQCQPIATDDCERWIADVAQPDASVIDTFCIKREASAWGEVK